MALITCPECQGSISDKAKTCVHCGCEIFVCPECGKASAEKLDACKYCGAPLTDAQKTAPVEEKEEFFEQKEEKQEELPNVSALISEFTVSSGLTRFMYKGIKIIRTIFSVFGVISFIIGFLIVLSPLIPQISLPKNLTAELGLIFVIVGDLLTIVNNLLTLIASFYTPLALENWIRKYNLDARLILKSILQNGTAGELSMLPKRANNLQPEAYQLATAALHVVNGEKPKTIVYYILSLVFFLISSGFTFMLLFLYITPIHEMLGNGFSSTALLLTFESFIPLIFVFIFIAIAFAIFNAVWTNKKKARELAWLQQNIPESFTYTKLQTVNTNGLK